MKLTFTSLEVYLLYRHIHFPLQHYYGSFVLSDHAFTTIKHIRKIYLSGGLSLCCCIMPRVNSYGHDLRKMAVERFQYQFQWKYVAGLKSLKSFLRSFSPLHCFKKGSCQLLAKVWALSRLPGLSIKPSTSDSSLRHATRLRFVAMYTRPFCVHNTVARLIATCLLNEKTMS